MYKYALVAAFLSLIHALPALSQSSHGYAFGAIGRETGYSNFFHAGVGGEWMVSHRLGVGGEVGGVTGRRSGAPNFALLSGNASYHLPIGDSRVDPFVTGGITGITTGGGGDLLWNWGGGVNWWVWPRFAVRLEFRDHPWFSGERHLAEFRFGVSFR